MSAQHHGPLSVVDSDEQLMARICRGDTEALGDLYDRYCGRAYRVALAVCRDPGRAEEAVQETFISIWRSPATYRADRGAVGAWLLAVARYRAVDVARRHGALTGRRTTDDALAAQPAPGDVSAEAVARADGRHLRGLLARLPDAQREVIALAFYGELSHAEIATRLELPAGTVKGRIRLGLAKLRTDLTHVAT